MGLFPIWALGYHGIFLLSFYYVPSLLLGTQETLQLEDSCFLEGQTSGRPENDGMSNKRCDNVLWGTD